MKQKKFLVRVLTVMIMAVMLTVNSFHVYAANAQDANRMNVVFVMDESGSMKRTDKEKLRYDAVDLFMGLATDTGNYMGAVAFDTEIILKEDIDRIDGTSSKEQLSKKIRSSQSSGDTDIGKAIETAVKMLEEQGNPDLPSAVILLSDGNTDLKSDAAYEASINSKNNAIAIAREKGYKIYSVCLNANGDADPVECEEISEATGGISIEVKNAEDLKDVFNQFYDIIYSTETVVLGDMIIPDSGEVEIPFNIPRVGVEEANIIISTLNRDTSYSLTQPSGITYTSEEMDNIRIAIDTFAILKLKEPADGQWILKVRGIPGDNVKIEMVYNADLGAELDVNSGNTSCMVDEDVVIKARLLDAGVAVDDKTIYQDYPMHVVITNLTTGGTEDYAMTAEDGCASYTYRIPAEADYEVYAYCAIDSIVVSSNVAKLSVSNTKPECLEDPIVIKKTISPFSDDEFLVDLSSYFTDSEDSELGYQITKSDFDKAIVDLSDSSLRIMVKEVEDDGSLYVKASDSQGASVEVEVIIKISSLVPLFIALGVLAALAVLAVLAIMLLKKKNKPIRGSVMILPYTEDGTLTPNTYDGVKGKMFVGRCLNVRENIGIDMKNTYFTAGEKDSYIYLVSKNGYYTDVEPDKKLKKIRLDSEMEVDISSDIDFMKGMKVTYIADEQDY